MTRSVRKQHTRICVVCKKEDLVERSNTKYCSIQCQQDHNFTVRYENWLNSILEDNAGVRSVKRFVMHRDSSCCKRCGISEWQGQPIVLELEHVDGNSQNNLPDNLCLLCPNCHSQTGTYKNKNIGKGRYSRRKRYSEGKSF